MLTKRYLAAATALTLAALPLVRSIPPMMSPDNHLDITVGIPQLDVPEPPSFDPSSYDEGPARLQPHAETLFIPRKPSLACPAGVTALHQALATEAAARRHQAEAQLATEQLEEPILGHSRRDLADHAFHQKEMAEALQRETEKFFSASRYQTLRCEFNAGHSI